MRNILRLDDKYAVKTSLNKEIFIQKANLTPKGREMLQKHLASVDLLYIIKKQKKELLVYFMEFVNWTSEYDEGNVVKTIISSMPYDCMVIMKHAKAIRVYIANQHGNSRNICKSAVEKLIRTASMIENRESFIETHFRESVHHAVETSTSIGELKRQIEEIFAITWKDSNEKRMKELRELGLLKDKYLPNADEPMTVWNFPKEITIWEEEELCEDGECYDEDGENYSIDDHYFYNG